MAIKYFCDRCGSSGDKTSHISQLKFEFEKDYGGAILIKKDLCESCTKQLNDWVQPLAKQDEAARIR